MRKLFIGSFITFFMLSNNLLADKTKLIENMCKSIMTVYGFNCPATMFKKAINNGCPKLITHKYTNRYDKVLKGMAVEFGESDPYNNKGECYLFAGTLRQRLDKNSALFQSDKGIYLLNNLPKGRYREGKEYLGVVKGNGMFKYITINGLNKTVSKGNVVYIAYNRPIA